METKAGKIIRNVATIDLRNATPAALAQIRRIENAATILYSPETADLVTGLTIENVANLVKVSNGAKLIMGQETFGRDAFKEQPTPLDLIVVGQMTLAPDIPVEELKTGLGSLIVNGQVICPKHLAGVLQSKLREITGQLITYTEQSKLVMGKLDLTPSYLQGLADNTELVVFGKVTATQALPTDLLAQKVKTLEVMGKLFCREENAAILLPRTTVHQVTTIPAGFTYVDRPLVLDANLLDVLPGKKLYASSVRIEADVTAEALDGAIDALQITDTLIAPAALRTVLGRKGNLLEMRTIFYTGTLWLCEDEMTLLPGRFAYLEGPATLVVFGELTIAADIEPALLAQNIAKLYSWGTINCTPEQMFALQARLGINQGEFTHAGQETAEEEEGNVIGNAAYLVL